ncbi:uncharacterized protein LOC121990857 [Zingiber officinale]|uniref:uncharacterized protein LOC121990857 n=1 Tax=Zingiber officinale TaxID=94328 RepID=UPI001C4B288B|nr:uncharacterized protein LOC121990857 [Zingiber officinale]
MDTIFVKPTVINRIMFVNCNFSLFAIANLDSASAVGDSTLRRFVLSSYVRRSTAHQSDTRRSAAHCSARRRPLTAAAPSKDFVHFVRDQKAIIWLFQQIMERFFKPKRFREGSSNDPNINEVVEIQSHVELDLNDIVSDPGLRKSIEEFDISIRDQVRRDQRNEEVSKVVNQNAPGNNQMISPAIQKDLTRACASEITLSIIEDIGNNVFSLMVDESRDISVKEQMRVVLRYVNKRGQLVIIAVAKSNLNASYFFNYVTMIVNTMGASCKRRDQLRQIEHDRIVVMLEGGDISTGSGKNQETNLVRPGDTRWGSHYLTLSRLLSMWPSVIQVLENICDDSSSFDSRGVAKSLIQKMENYEFVFMLHLMKMILGMTNELSLVLQQKDQNIVQAISLIESVKDQFQIFREDGWHTIIDKVNTFCELNEIPVPEMKDNCMIGGRSRRRRQVITNLHYYRVEIFYQVVDSVIQEMNTRFSEVGTELLSCIACLYPRNFFSEFNVQKLVRLCDLYPEDFSTNDCIVIEQQLQNFIHNIRQDPNFFGIEDLGSFAQKIVETQKNQAYPLVYRLIEMTLVLPVATASVERVFSAMKTIKTDLRNRMGDEWMNDSLVVYIEKDIFSTIENEQILQRFQKMKSRRMQLPPLSYPTIT